jgi:hypothetical protein
MLGEGYRLKVSAKRVARRIFGPKRRKWQEAAEDCTVYASPNIIRLIT